MGSSKHTKTFFGKIFYNFFYTPMKNIFIIISRFFPHIFLDLVKICVFKVEYISIECNEGFFLDVNQKRRFLDLQNIPKTTKLKKFLPKKIS